MNLNLIKILAELKDYLALAEISDEREEIKSKLKAIEVALIRLLENLIE